MSGDVGDVFNKPGAAIGGLLGGGAAAGGGPLGILIGSKIGSKIGGGGSPNAGINGPDTYGRPQWNLTNPDGTLRSDLQLGSTLPASATQSQGVLDKLQSRATTEGPTQSAQYLMDQNGRNTQNSLGQADAMMRSDVANASNSLAMRGGLDSGARERLMRGATANNMLGQQKILNDANGSNLNVLANDEAQKLQTLQALSPQLLNQAGFQQGQKKYDIDNTLNTAGNKYNQDMQAWAANQTASEQAALANKKNGMFGLGILGL